MKPVFLYFYFQIKKEEATGKKKSVNDVLGLSKFSSLNLSINSRFLLDSLKSDHTPENITAKLEDEQQELQKLQFHDAIPLTGTLEEEVSKASMTEVDFRLYPFIQVSKLKRKDFKSALVNILLETRAQKSKWVLVLVSFTCRALTIVLARMNCTPVLKRPLIF